MNDNFEDITELNPDDSVWIIRLTDHVIKDKIDIKSTDRKTTQYYKNLSKVLFILEERKYTNTNGNPIIPYYYFNEFPYCDLEGLKTKFLNKIKESNMAAIQDKAWQELLSLLTNAHWIYISKNRKFTFYDPYNTIPAKTIVSEYTVKDFSIDNFEKFNIN